MHADVRWTLLADPGSVRPHLQPTGWNTFCAGEACYIHSLWVFQAALVAVRAVTLLRRLL